jgi:hypothetical protein
MKWITRKRVKVDWVACRWLIIRSVDPQNALHHQPEGPGLNAIAEGFRHLGYADDLTVNHAEWIVSEALYAYCQETVQGGQPAGAFI